MNCLWMSFSFALAAVVLGGCRPQQVATAVKTEPAKIELIEGTNLHRVTLSETAAGRLGIQTAVVREGAEARTVIPYTAVFYDALGNSWTYTSPQPLTFVREAIGGEYIDGNSAVLLAGPPLDTAMVTVGAPELFGAEFGVGH